MAKLKWQLVAKLSDLNLMVKLMDKLTGSTQWLKLKVEPNDLN